MSNSEVKTPIRYYATKSDADLREVCSHIRMEYGLPEFAFNCENNWEYGYSEGAHIAVNVTKTQCLNLISTWIDNAPDDVNYQIILYGNTSNSFEGLLSHTFSSNITEYNKSGSE